MELFHLVPIFTYLLQFLDASLIVVRFPDISDLFYKRLEEGNTDTDPLTWLSREERQQVCDDVILAKEFNYKRSHVNISKYVNQRTSTDTDLATLNYQRSAFSEHPDPTFLQYYDQHVLVGDLDLPLCIFPCMNTADHIWYVTYAFKDQQMFLVESRVHSTSTTTSSFKLTGIIEPRASFNKAHWTTEELTILREYFINQVKADLNSHTKKILQNRKLTSSSLADRIRLCSSIFDILSTPENGYFEEKKINYFRTQTTHRRLTLVRVTNEEPFSIKRTRFVSCLVNDEPRFYLLADPLKQRAVFVFLNATKINEVFLAGSIDDVPVLYELDQEQTSMTVSEENTAAASDQSAETTRIKEDRSGASMIMKNVSRDDLSTENHSGATVVKDVLSVSGNVGHNEATEIVRNIIKDISYEYHENINLEKIPHETLNVSRSGHAVIDLEQMPTDEDIYELQSIVENKSTGILQKKKPTDAPHKFDAEKGENSGISGVRPKGWRQIDLEKMPSDDEFYEKQGVVKDRRRRQVTSTAENAGWGVSQSSSSDVEILGTRSGRPGSPIVISD